MKLKYSYKAGEFGKVFTAKYQPVARAATAAITEATDDAKQLGRASIAAAGGRFGKSWQKALQSRVFPRSPKVSANAAGLIWLKSRYGGIFEYGGTITGSPWLWLPLRSSPSTMGRKKLTPALFRQQIGPLQFIHPPGKSPMLVAKIDRKRGRGDRRGRTVSLAALKRGASMTSGYSTVPIFVGIPKVTIQPKFAIRKAAETAAAKLPGLYYKFLKDD